MGRKQSPKRAEAFILWLTERKRLNLKLKDIAQLLDVSPEQIRKWKSQDCWDKPVLLKKEGIRPNINSPASWLEIEMEYVSDIRSEPCKLKDLAIKYDIPYQTVKWQASKYKWRLERKKFIQSLYQKTQEKAPEVTYGNLRPLEYE